MIFYIMIHIYGTHGKKGGFHDAAPAADSAALRGVCAPTTFNLNAQRRRMAGGVPARPLVSAGTRARNCSPNHCVQQGPLVWTLHGHSDSSVHSGLSATS